MRVALVNPPFANYRRPSIGLTQLRAAVRNDLADVQVDIHNVNLDCVTLIGKELYDEVSDGFQSWTGLGDWLFRSLAFPDVADNRDEYLSWLQRPQTGWFTHNATEPHADISAQLLASRERLCEALPGYIDSRALAEYDVVGVSSMFAQTLCALAILRLVKERNPGVITVLGGANCESPMGGALLEKFPFVDRVFSGRSTVSFPAFLKFCQQNPSLSQSPEIPGVLQRDGSKPQGLVSDSAAAIERGVDTAVNPAAGPAVRNTTLFSASLDYDDFIDELAAAPFESEVVLPFETSTGCWWGQKSHCTFCGLNSTTMAYSALEPVDAISLIQGLVDRYSSVCGTFEAVDNILSHTYLKDVLPQLRIPSHVSLFYEIKANLTETHVQTLAAAQVRRIQPGIEALSTRALRLLRKGVDAPHNVALLRNCAAHDVSVDWNLLVAIPGEPLSVYEHTLREAPKLTHLEPPAGALEIRFDRYSPYFDHPEEFNLRIAPYRFYSFLYPFDDTWLSEVAYFFDWDGEKPNAEETDAQIARLRAVINDWRERWNQNPRPTLKLEAHDTTPIVTDTRDASNAVRHRLTSTEARALQYLKQPRHFDNLQQFLRDGGSSAGETDATIAALRHQRWLFEDEPHLVSIVVDAGSRVR